MRETLEAAKNGVEEVRREFTKPDDDWQPVMLALDRDGDLVASDLSQAMESNETQAMFWNTVCPQLLIIMGATEVAAVTSMWWADARPGDVAADGRRYASADKRPANRDDRKECLCISWAHKSGETDSLMAEIIRHEDAPPTLDWTVLERIAASAGVPVEAVATGGRIQDALLAGVTA